MEEEKENAVVNQVEVLEIASISSGNVMQHKYEEWHANAMMELLLSHDIFCFNATKEVRKFMYHTN
jgi:hypothetical protein